MLLLFSVIDDEAHTVYTAGAIVTVTVTLHRQDMSVVMNRNNSDDEENADEEEKPKEKEDEKAEEKTNVRSHFFSASLDYDRKKYFQI